MIGSMCDPEPDRSPGPLAAKPAATDSAVPKFCDFGCPYADFPPPETAGICRTMAAVQCGKLGELVNKNAPCEWRRRQRAVREA